MFRIIGADGVQVGYYGTEAGDWSRHRDSLRPTAAAAEVLQIAVKIMFQATRFVRFQLERGLRFRDLGFCGHGLV